MQYVYFAEIIVVLSIIVLFGCLKPEAKCDDNPATKPIMVKVKSLSYEPKKLEIHAGDSVVFINSAFTRHTATSDDDGKTFDTGDIEPGKSSEPVKFDKEGEFKYHCKVHGKSMSGTIVVKAAEK
jgi:plastocyanin